MFARRDVFSTGEPAFAVDRSGQIVDWNQAAELVLGYTESQALGQQCWELLSGRDVFGNPSCCDGCPIGTAAFNGEPVNRFQFDYKTAANENKRFSVIPLILFNDSDKEMFVHLCRPARGVRRSEAANHLSTCTTAQNRHRTLTPRETEVLAHLHKGMTVPEIATALSICVPTVRNHTQHILSKLHVHSRFEAVALGRELGLI